MDRLIKNGFVEVVGHKEIVLEIHFRDIADLDFLLDAVQRFNGDGITFFYFVVAGELLTDKDPAVIDLQFRLVVRFP